MGMARRGRDLSDLYFMAVESYSSEGGVIKGDIFGHINICENVYGRYKLIQRPAKKEEIIVYQLYGGISNRDLEIESIARDLKISDILTTQLV